VTTFDQDLTEARRPQRLEDQKSGSAGLKPWPTCPFFEPTM
jgi:hypothetical protein